MEFHGGGLGSAFNVDEHEIGVVLLEECWRLKAGDEVRRIGRVMDVLVSDGLLGRVIDPLTAEERLPVEGPAAPIMDRMAELGLGACSPGRANKPL